ncbi:hypothetical protein N9T42_02380 [SAR86 cluster bacterium]|jgi:hypothetical protein|nr:hypothetical protein [SAR86 cluster bacterium]
MFRTIFVWVIKAIIVISSYIFLFPIIAEPVSFSMEKFLKLFLEADRQGTYIWIISSLLITILLIGFLIQFLFKLLKPYMNNLLRN